MPEIWHNKRQKSIFFETNKLIRPKWSTLFFYKQLAIIGRGWAKYHDLSVASRSIICQSPRLRQITDLRDTDGSRYFAITEFNYCFIIQSPSFFLMNIFGKRSDLLFFSRKNDWKKEESVVSFTMSRILFAAEHSWTILRMSRPLFLGNYLEVMWWAFG